MDERDSIDRRPKVSRAGPERCRRDGWTAERQLRFLDALGRTRSVTRAARAAGMSRESAYRLRRRREAALFAAAWDKALQPRPIESHEVGHGSRLAARLRSAGYGANPPKVTKRKKCTTPRFEPFDKPLRDLLHQLRSFD